MAKATAVVAAGMMSGGNFTCDRLLDRIGVGASLECRLLTLPGSCGAVSHFLADGVAYFPFGAHELVIELQVHPHARGDPEEATQAQVVFGSAAAFALFHLGEMGGGNSAAPGDLGLGQVRLLKCFTEGFGEEIE